MTRVPVADSILLSVVDAYLDQIESTVKMTVTQRLVLRKHFLELKTPILLLIEPFEHNLEFFSTGSIEEIVKRVLGV